MKKAFLLLLFFLLLGGCVVVGAPILSIVDFLEGIPPREYFDDPARPMYTVVVDEKMSDSAKLQIESIADALNIEELTTDLDANPYYENKRFVVVSTAPGNDIVEYYYGQLDLDPGGGFIQMVNDGVPVLLVVGEDEKAAVMLMEALAAHESMSEILSSSYVDLDIDTLTPYFGGMCTSKSDVGDIFSLGFTDDDEDRCLSDVELLEYHCRAGIQYREVVECEAGCQNGACGFDLNVDSLFNFHDTNILLSKYLTFEFFNRRPVDEKLVVSQLLTFLDR